MEVNNRHMSDPNSQCDVDTEFMEQQFYNKNDSAFDDNASYEKSSTISQDGRTLGYEDGKNDDLGPETNVDTLDDASDNCTLINASRELFSNEKSDNNLTVENELGDTFLCPSNNTNEHHNITSVDNVGDSDESDDEWNFYRIEPNQETENSLQPKVSSVVSEVGEEIVEPEILENYKDLLISDEKLNLCNQNPEKSEEKESFFSPDKSEINENNEDLLLPEIQDNCSEEMDFSLNPNAAEFVPVSSPPSIPSRFMDLPISGSPLKQTSMMDDINLPSPKEFKEEASHRPHEVEEEDNEIISINGNVFTGENIEEFDGKKKAALNLDESEISSTRAEFGDESNISFLATDFQKASGFDGSFTESCTEYENDPMAMSMGPDGFNVLSNPVDLNAIHDLNDSDLCDINYLGEEKEQTLTPVDDDHSQPLDLKSPNSNELQLKLTPSEHENTNNNIMCTLSPSEELNVKDIENNTDEIISQVAAMNLKNEQLSEVCLENTNDFMNNTDNIKNNDQTQDDSLLTEQKPAESLFLESQHVPLENVEIQTPQNKFDSSLENCLISCDESENLEHHQEIILTDQCNENTFSDSEKLASHDSINIQAITKSEPTFNNECEFKNEEQKKNEEKDNVPDISVNNNFTNVLVDIVPTKAQNGENSIIEKENTDITVSPRKSMELSKSLQEFTGLEKELSPTENNKNLMEIITKTSATKSSPRVTPAALSKPLVGVVSRSTNSSADAKKVTGVGVAGNSVDVSKASTLNKPSSKPGIKSAPRLTSASQSKSSVTKVPLTTTNTEKKSTVTTNGDSKANKIPPKSRTSTVDVPSKPLVKSTVSSTRLTTTTKSKSSVGTTESKPGLKTTVEVKSSGINVRPRTAPSALTTTKSRTSNPVKSSIVDKNVKETANKQILNRTTSTTNSRASNQGLHSTTTTVSATTKRSTTTVRTTKQQSSLTRTTAKNIKTSIKTNVNKTQLPNNVNEIKNVKVIEESLSAVTIANTENVSEKDSTTPTIENQQIIGQEL
ncbi:hypothetical protein G9C98_001796 [Cotesia typhae]|uniref:Uncharacterized protein n=1 Tax=Cotesia typhae TaxID=2053667 RepID=A0A8J5R7T0_9HYME|nr:hypothetical protein G9C98_001796 [Cotesia typhae]